MRKILLTYLLLFYAAPLLAAELNDEEEGVKSVYATVCENLRNGEPKSSARMRATDKASFKALENLSDLSDYRDKYDEDLAVRTLAQDNEKICVEVTGYLSTQNIARAVSELSAKQEAKYPDQLVVEQAALTEPSPTALPPKPELKISEDIAVEKILEEEKTLPQKQIASDPISQARAAVDDGKTKVFCQNACNR